jgi:hypothetical protein
MNTRHQDAFIAARLFSPAPLLPQCRILRDDFGEFLAQPFESQRSLTPTRGSS